MNDKLISSLRICGRINSANDNCIAFHDGSCEAEPVCMYELMGKAADAFEKLQADKAALNETVSNLIQQIAELSKDLERSKEWETFWEKEANEALKKFQTTVANKSRWIPVSERLPQEAQRCIVVSKCGEMAFAIYKGNRFQYPHYMGKATHWMPLPQAPKEE